MKQLEATLDGEALAEDDFSSDSYYDSESDDYGDESDEATKGKEKDNEMMDGEGEEAKNENDDEEDRVAKELDEIDEFETKVELKSAIDLIKSPINRIDEFDSFNGTVRSFAQMSPQIFTEILKLMTPQQNDQLKSLLRTKRVTLANNEKTAQQ